jgi:hypothetical protein
VNKSARAQLPRIRRAKCRARGPVRGLFHYQTEFTLRPFHYQAEFRLRPVHYQTEFTLRPVAPRRFKRWLTAQRGVAPPARRLVIT